MKSIPIILLFSTFLFIITANAEQAPAPRIIKLIPAARAVNDDGDYIFKRPRHFVMTDDGRVFLSDQSRVLVFDKKLKFNKIIVERGRGPAEATHIFQIFLHHDRLVVNTGFMAKLMVFDFKGNLEAEYKQKSKLRSTKTGFNVGESTFRILGPSTHNDYIVQSFGNRPKANRNNAYSLQPLNLLSKQNILEKHLCDIPVEAALVEGPQGAVLLDKASVISTWGAGKIFLCTSCRYAISIYDVAKNNITSTFKRKYQPVPIPEHLVTKIEYGQTMMIGSRDKNYVLKPPSSDSFHDIQAMFFIAGRVWVVTSTVDRQKGVLVDVFTADGRHIDSFYLCFPEKLDLHRLYREEICINKSEILVRQLDENDHYTVKKYRFPKNWR